MTDKDLYKPAPSIIKNSHANEEIYEKMYRESISSPEEFWRYHGPVSYTHLRAHET